MININDIFFDGLYREVWKQIIPEGQTLAECDMLAGFCAEGGKVLDLMCGYGRHSIPLGRTGRTVVAVDNDPEYIRELSLTAATENIPVKAVQSPVLDFEPAELFDLAICMGNSFSFFDPLNARRFLRIASRSLNSKGRLIINSWMIAEIAIKHFREKDWYYVGEYKCLLDYQYCFLPSRIESEQITIGPDNSIEKKQAVDYIYSIDDLADMLEKEGMKISGLYATPRKKPFKVGDMQVYIVAEKSIP